MNTYEILIKDTRSGSIVINAENEEEARNNVAEYLGMIDWQSDSPDIEIEQIIEV